MKFAPLVPLAAALLLAACSNNDSAETATDEGMAAGAESTAQAGSSEDARGDSKPSIDPDTPASQFTAMDDAASCLGAAWHFGDDEDKERVRFQFAKLIGGGKFHSITDSFARKDYIASLEQDVASRVAAFEDKRLYSFTTEVGDDPYREYNFDQQGFFDSSKITWGGSARAFSQHEGRGGMPANCVIHWTNGAKWAGPQSNFTVRDEQEARAASAALAARKSAVKVYFHVDDVVQSDTISEWPQVEASIVRIELVDAEGNKLATALPVMSDEEAAAKEAEKGQFCHINPMDCM